MHDYGSFLTALASEGQPTKAFEALEALTNELVGVKLFTVMTNDNVADGKFIIGPPIDE